MSPLGAEVPFSEDRSLVADFLQEFGEGHLIGIETVSIALESVLVTVLTRKDTSPAWSADRIGAEVRFEESSFRGNPVDVRSVVDFRTVSRDGLGGVIVREDEDDIGFCGPQCKPWQKDSQGQEVFCTSEFVFRKFHFS